MITPIEIIIQGELAKVQLTSADLEPAAQHQIQRIQERTASGVDSDGQPWPPYAPNSGKVGTVTLGSLASSIVPEVDPGGITLAIAGQQGQIAEFHNNGTSRIPRRHFFDVSAADHELMKAEIAAAIQGRSK